MTATGTTRQRAIDWIARLHDDVTAFFERLDGRERFREDRWERPGGGGGNSRVLVDGALFEKAGVNRSVVEGATSPGMLKRLGDGQHSADHEAAKRFFATGVSLVVHPRSPRVPTVHLNVRYFELATEGGEVVDAWFGGGTDLTPMYPDPEDAVTFHRALKAIADRHHPEFHPRFKHWCDEYFVNTHRNRERRGVGGIFYDFLQPGSWHGLSEDALFAFADDVGRSLEHAYEPIVDRARDLPYGDRERQLQLFRRGRYVEFNLVHDRGTIFGLQTNARIESVLMSLPPLAAWEYAPTWEPGSIEARLHDMLVPRDWLAGA